MQRRSMSATVVLVTVGIAVSGVQITRARAAINAAPERFVAALVGHGGQIVNRRSRPSIYSDGPALAQMPELPRRAVIAGFVPDRVGAPRDCPIDGYEANDTFAAAYGPISPGIAHCGAYICPNGDVDWFKFAVTSGQEITVDLDSLPADFDLRLYDPSGTLIDTSTNPGTAAEQIVHTASMTGDYRSYVFGYDGAYSEDDYCISVTLSEEPTPTPTPTSTPTPMSTGTATHTSTSTPTATPTDTPYGDALRDRCTDAYADSHTDPDSPRHLDSDVDCDADAMAGLSRDDP